MWFPFSSIYHRLIRLDLNAEFSFMCRFIGAKFHLCTNNALTIPINTQDNTDVLHHIMVPGFLPCFEFLVNATGFSILVFEVLKLVFIVLVSLYAVLLLLTA